MLNQLLSVKILALYYKIYYHKRFACRLTTFWSHYLFAFYLRAIYFHMLYHELRKY